MSDGTSFVRLFVGFLLSATGVQATCPIELSPASVVVRYGDSVSINCSTSASEFELLGWEATKGGKSVEEVKHVVWTVENLTDWKMSPVCFINQLTVDQCSLKPKLIIYTFPESVSMDPRGGVMSEGETYDFTCDIHKIAPVQNLTVKWYKGGEMVHTDTFDDPSKAPLNTSVFSFTPSRRDDGATFRCEAQLDLSPEGPQLNASSPEYSIKVHFGPDVRCSGVFADQLELQENETLEMRCAVTGNPTPTVRWLKDGQPADPTVPLSREDAGVYTVESEGAKLTRKTLRVVILYGPELTCPRTHTALEDAPHNLTCTVQGYPKPETVWSKDGEDVELPEKLTRRDTGQYLITAFRNLSSVNVTVEINVVYPPSKIVELEDSEVDVGSSVWLKCSSTANPRPRYTWEYYRTANVEEQNEDGVSRLHIHNATVYNMGSYTCHAGNDFGNVSDTARVTVKGAGQECPVEITPDRMVVQYQSQGQRATCTPTVADSAHAKEVFWQLGQGVTTNDITWLVDTDNDWDARPVCTAEFNVIGICQKQLDFTLYKMPDSVTIRPVQNVTWELEGGELQLQCDITNVAPAGKLVVRWYQGNETFEPPTNGSMQVTGCRPENGTSCDVGAVRSPLNVSSSINITLNRKHNGVEFRCEAQLDLGESHPQPNMTSSPLNISVYYKPSINTTKLPKRVPVFRGYPEELVCEADGHPPPTIQWLYSPDKVPRRSEDTPLMIIVSEAGVYTCNATNEVGSTSHEVEVILKEDYLPLIAGFVAVTVVAISIVFLFIYSIYYKNTKMRRYSLQKAKLDTRSDNVAHNGWDMQFPMTKLS